MSFLLSPHWMSPECLLSDNYNELVDIWSLGQTSTEHGQRRECERDCSTEQFANSFDMLLFLPHSGITTYELAVGQPPHAELHSLRAALKIPMCDPPTLPHPERYSPELHSFIKSCLVKDYTRRPSAAELLTHPFITRNTSTQAILSDMIAKTRASIESKAASDGLHIDAAKPSVMPANRLARSSSESDH